jgi:hypothetical protein
MDLLAELVDCAYMPSSRHGKQTLTVPGNIRNFNLKVFDREFHAFINNEFSDHALRTTFRNLANKIKPNDY